MSSNLRVDLQALGIFRNRLGGAAVMIGQHVHRVVGPAFDGGMKKCEMFGMFIAAAEVATGRQLIEHNG